MAGSSIETLRRALLTRYDDLMRRLTRRLGSEQDAEEALQDTWLKLQRTMNVGEVRNEDGYILRTAVNLAKNRRHSDRHLARAEDIDEALSLFDDTPNPERVALARSELRALERAVDALPARQREIFLAAHRDGVPHAKIAEAQGVSVRWIDMELAAAREFCAKYIKKEQKRFQDGREDRSND